MTDDEIRAAIAGGGLLKFPRAYVRRMGWPRPPGGGLPPEWYAAFRGELGDQLERILQ